METDDEKISARIKMIDETEVTQSAQALTTVMPKRTCITFCSVVLAALSKIGHGHCWRTGVNFTVTGMVLLQQSSRD